MNIQPGFKVENNQNQDKKAVKEASAMLWTKMFESALKGIKESDEQEDPMKTHVIEEQAKQMGELAAEHFKSQWEAQLQWTNKKS